tara:strand:+ start:5644 stop:7026 length:1383 start_codon:yes stop_codon:yes gene_type:complete
MEPDMSKGNEPTRTALEQAFDKALSPFQTFIEDQKTSSILLIVATLMALAIANSDWFDNYRDLLGMHLGILLGNERFAMSLGHWINDGLMALFFFVLGIEIKRELLAGELRELKQVAPILAAAVGGMLLPALIYYAINTGSPTVVGWGIPMATDTAFAIGLLVLLGERVPKSAFAFLTALAIIDDIGAILVIAFFYSEEINPTLLVLAAVMLAGLALCNVLGIRRPSAYLIGGVAIWVAMLGSGVHATLAGILVAATIPARPRQDTSWFLERAKTLLQRFETIEDRKQQATPILEEEEQHAVAEDVIDAAGEATTPLRRWEQALRDPVALLVMPIFAFANAGIGLDEISVSEMLTEPLAIGILLGMVVGKGIGIPLFAWVAIRCKIGQLPAGLSLRHVVGLGLLGGIGFTMAIFISSLGFGQQPETLVMAKASILLGSTLAGVLGYLWLLQCNKGSSTDY